jgi:hypothetical protein
MIIRYYKHVYKHIKMYTINIIHSILSSKSDINQNTQEEILHILQITLEQNYFQFGQQYYKQTIGLAMVASTSTILADTYYSIWNTHKCAHY